ncbi:MAG: FAD-dependent oxidoreductase, partial [Candidatus Aquicultor sp.]
GSQPLTLPVLPEDETIAMNTTQALEINEVPKSITIIGGGAYGVEFSSLFRSLGSEVSLVERSPRLIPRDDADISKYLERAFSKRGIAIHTSSKVEAAVRVDNRIEVEISKNDEGQTIRSDTLLVTAGRVGNLESIDTDSLGIDTKDGFIKTGPDMKTGADGVYAVGDVTHNPQYANFAFSEGIHAAETIAGINPPPLNLRQIPIYTFGYPQLAKVGYSEDEAKEAGYDIETVGLPFQVISRSAINKEDIGFAKMVSVKGGPIIGVHLIGPDVVDLIPEAMLITNWEATAEDVAQFLHPHPTFTEAIGEAALKLAGKPLHSL